MCSIFLSKMFSSCRCNLFSTRQFSLLPTSALFEKHAQHSCKQTRIKKVTEDIFHCLILPAPTHPGFMGNIYAPSSYVTSLSPGNFSLCKLFLLRLLRLRNSLECINSRGKSLENIYKFIFLSL